MQIHPDTNPVPNTGLCTPLPHPWTPAAERGGAVVVTGDPGIGKS